MRLYDVRETAALLSISSSTVWRLIKRRELPVVRIGASVRVSDRAIARYIERREVFDGGGKPSYASRVTAS
jgi:excisionase family DNA binding protein